jgi:outer membrane protein assembly factor BamB
MPLTLQVARSLALVFSALVACQSLAEDWPQWRGPNRDNNSSETGLLKTWPEGGPPLEWQVEGIGEGIATVSILQGRIYTVGYQGDSEYAVALNQATGDLLWATRLGPTMRESALMRWLTQRVPTLENEQAYFIRADGELICLNTSNGAELWRKSYIKDFGAAQPGFGFCDYPLVDGDRLICSPGSAEAGLAALHKQTGEVIWKLALPNVTSTDYSAIVAAEIGGVRQYIKASTSGTHGISARDGKLLWTHSGRTQRYSTLAPYVRGNDVLISYGVGLLGLKVIPADEGFKVEQTFDGGQLQVQGFQDRTAIVGDHVYAFQLGGDFICVSRLTGEQLWPIQPAERGAEPAGRSRRGRRGITLGTSPIALLYADGNLIARDPAGGVKLIEASPLRYVEKGSFKIPGHEQALGVTAPVVSGGRLYLRDDNRLSCYDLRAGRSGAAATARKISLRSLSQANQPQRGESGPLRSVFVTTPHDVVNKMLELAKVQKDDVVYDLGSGDGRVVIAAAKTFGCKAVGFEIDEQLVELSRKKAQEAGVGQLVTIEPKDLFTANLTQATVITVYLLSKQLEALAPQLTKLKPGTRIVSHQFAIPGIKTQDVQKLTSAEDGEEHTVYLWTAPVESIK